MSAALCSICCKGAAKIACCQCASVVCLYCMRARLRVVNDAPRLCGVCELCHAEEQGAKL